MLEIVLLYFLCKRLGEMLRGKGQSPLPYQIMLVVFWFGGEFLAGVAAGVLYAVQNGGASPEPFDLTVYLFAMMGAACGAGLAFLIAHLLPDNQAEATYGTPGGFEFNPNYRLPTPDPNNPYSPPQTRS
jgi:hypothetical protein